MAFLGVDVGSSKSHALICDAQGRALGVGIGGGGNHESVGRDGFQRVLESVVNDALNAANLSRSDIQGMGFGIAGYDWDEDTPMINEVIGALNIPAPFEAMNDAGPGLLAGSRHGWGVSVSAGTGVNARGRGPNGESARMTGNGIMFAEIGGGTELMYHVIEAISRAWSLRAPQTMLTDSIVKFTGAKNAEDLLAGIARGRYHVRARAALLVFEAAAAGDEVALNAIKWLGEGLGDLALGIIRQLEIEPLAFDIVLSGSIFQGSPLILDTMRAVVHQRAPHADFVHLQAPPVAGAVMLGMQNAGVDFLPVREQIITGARKVFTAPVEE